MLYIVLMSQETHLCTRRIALFRVFGPGSLLLENSAYCTQLPNFAINLMIYLFLNIVVISHVIKV